jgi:hypothetical protein
MREETRISSGHPKSTDQKPTRKRGRLMRHHPSKQNMVWTVLFSLLAALALNACSDSNNVAGPPGPEPLTITSGSPLPSGSIGIAYSATLAASGGNPAYTWSRVASSPALPNGLSLSPAGVISGTPTTIQTLTPKFRVVDTSTSTPQAVEKDLTIAINAVPQPSISAPPLLNNGIVSTAYSATLTAAGGTPPYTTWTVNPPLPAGLIFTPAGPTATISGMPTAPSNRTHTFSVTDSFSPNPQTVTRDYTLTITLQPLPLTIATNSLPNGTVQQQDYNATLVASGGTPPLTWSRVSGSLPPGLQLNQNNGVITGVPTTAGTFSPTFRVQDVGTPQQSVEKQLTIIISLPAAPNITTTSASLLPNGTFNQFYTRTLQVSGGVAPFVWSFTGGSPFPNWLNLNHSTGVISGTPNTTGTFNFNVQVTDNTGQSDPTPPFLSITIVPQAPPTITPFTLPNGTVNVVYPDTQLAATGGIQPYTWSVDQALPNGLSFSPSGLISGIPLDGSNGTTSHTFRVTDSTAPIGQSGALTRTLTINAALTINENSLPAGTVGIAYNAPPLTASGGTPPYTWSITGTGAPDQAAPGLSLSSGGVISGTPSTTTGSPFTRTYRVQDNNGVATTKSLAITVNAGLTIDTTSPLPDGKEKQPYGPLTMQASGGTPPYNNWGVTPDLPTGLRLDASTGEISGEPDTGTAGLTTHTFSVQDSMGASVSKPNISLTIDP